MMERQQVSDIIYILRSNHALLSEGTDANSTTFVLTTCLVHGSLLIHLLENKDAKKFKESANLN